MVKETTNKKPTTKAKSAPAKVVEEKPVVVESEKAEKESKPARTPKTFKQSEGIPCRSVVNGPMYMSGIRSAMPYQWLDYGDMVDVEYRDLVAAVREKNGYIMNPWVVVMDEDFLDEYPFLKDLYAKQYTSNDLAKILQLSVPQMKEEVEKLPKNVKDTLKGIASTWINDGRLDSIKKIKALDELLDTDLALLAEFSNE